MSEVVAGGVFNQARVAVEERARAGHYFHPRNPFPSKAVTNHLDAARIGGHVATNL